jgi:hypothetical protein
LRFQIDVVQKLLQQIPCRSCKVHVRRAVGDMATDIAAAPVDAAFAQPLGEAAAEKGKSGISAACAPLTTPHITATINNRRIATLHRTL